MSTLRGKLRRGTPGQMSLLKQGLLLREAADTGSAWSRRARPPSPSALMAHLTAAPLAGCCLALSSSSAENRGKFV